MFNKSAIQGDYNASLQRLRTARGFVLDMDGTLVLGNKSNQGLNPLPGALDFTKLLNDRGLPFVIFTNGTPRVPAAYAAMLREAGFSLDDEQMMTPSCSAVDVFLRRKFGRVCVLGGDGMVKPLQEAGIETIQATGKPEADAVFVGWFYDFNMRHLEAACHAVWNGAQLFSASQSLFFATAEGRAIGPSRAICAMIRDLTGARINIVGKPSQHALRSASRRLGIPAQQLAVVGDDPSLEIPMALKGKALAVAVNTGIGDAAAYTGMAELKRPHLFVESIGDLLGFL
jgi:NagD protein